nr:DUF2071 domain-containing protein [Natronorubrum texcoconense]
MEPHLPERLTLDTYDEQAWLSVVPFTNVEERLRVFLPERELHSAPSNNLKTI